ncbi:MAG: hypothetical protein HRT58_14435 [Crocinitomicaceae bacterium]|nr:S41 family peptidase [Flavobacteriales bacterium]NQZ36864.1 hypothetical protein [Crocinitomicaceae bacterium]
MFKKISFLGFCCLAFLSFGQSSDYTLGAKISPDKLKADFSILLSSLRENHPGLYDFTSKSQFDSLATKSLVSLTDSLTEREFHVLVRKFIRVIACGHTVARPSQDWYKAVSASKNLIPIHVILQDDQLYIRKVFGEQGDGLIGARVISIGGVSVNEILLVIKSIIMRDGVGEAMVSRNIERLFQTYYMFSFGMKETYTVEAERVDGVIIKASLIGGKASKYPARKVSELAVEMENQGAEFRILGKSKKIAVLDLSSFDSKGYKRFYRKVFSRLSEFDSIDLVLDLRGNGGGYFPNGNQLLRYLLNENFTMDFSKPQKHTKNNKHLKLNFPSMMTRFIFSTIPDRNKEDPARNYQIRYKSIKKDHFYGKVYVLTDGLTFSAGSSVASKLKNSRSAIVVGEETGGGEVGFNAVLSWRLELPNSGMIVTIPIYHVDVQPEMNDIGRGVTPDIPVQYNLEQRMGQIDLEMVRILKSL